MASIFFLCSCRNEADALQETTSNSLQIQKFGSSQLISINTVKKEIKNFSKIQNKFISSTAAKTSTIIDSDNVLYRKWENTTTGTKTYTLPINTYSAQMPYYMIQQILVSSNGAETTRYLKIIPTTPPAYKTQDVLKNLTGSVEIYNENLSFVFATDYINGVATKNNEQMANKSAGECTTSFTITEVTCSNGGGHGVGASCDTGLTNDAHYVVNIDISCPNEFGPATIGNPESSGSGSLGGGYVFDEQLNALLTNPTFLYGDYLTLPGHELLLQIVRQWIPANVTDINGDLSELNTRLQHFSNNDQMFNDLATYNQNTPNVPNAEVTDYSIRVYELFKFLLNNPSPENGQIAAWAVSFFDQNRFISWEEFKNSYIMNAGFISYINTLPMSLKQVIYNQSNQEFLYGLNTYYSSQTNSQQAQNFINWALQFKAGNTATTWAQFQNWFIKADGSSKITINTTSNSNALTFNNMVEFKNYITGFKNSFTPDASSFESINNTNITKFKAKFDILAPVYLNIHAKSTLEDPNTYATEFDLLEVNSFKSGISAFLTWNQDSYGHSVDGHVVEINLNGHFDIGVKIGDLDFTYADSYIIKAKYNNITGNAMSISGTPD